MLEAVGATEVGAEEGEVGVGEEEEDMRTKGNTNNCDMFCYRLRL